MSRSRIYIALIAAGCALSASSQQVWTYDDCVAYAREHNISLQKSLLNSQSAEYTLEEAKAQWEPTLDFATTHSFTNYPWGQGTKNGYNSSYGLNAGWTVWNGSKRENTIKRDRLDVEMSNLNSQQIFRTIETDLLQVYINILYARESIGISEEAAALSKAQSERARQLMEAGRLSRVDYARLYSQYEQDNYSVVNARATYDSRRMELKQLLELGLDADISLQDVEWTAEQVLAALPPADESYQLALDNDLELKSLALGNEAAGIDIDIAKAGRMPNISLSAGVGSGYSAPGGAFGTSLKQRLNESVGLTFSLPILDNKRTKMAVARAKVQQADAVLDIDKRRNTLSQEVENWYIDTRSAQARYCAAVEQLKSAQLTDELTNEQFRLGYVNTIELLTAHNSYIEARHLLLQAKYMAMLGRKMIDYYRTTKVSL